MTSEIKGDNGNNQEVEETITTSQLKQHSSDDDNIGTNDYHFQISTTVAVKDTTNSITTNLQPSETSTKKPKTTSTTITTATTLPTDKRPKKRGSNQSRAKRKRKRPKGGIGIYNCADGTNGDDGDTDETPYKIETEILPLERYESGADETNGKISQASKITRRIRVVKPYPFTFATFAKARWLGRTILDIYHEEFGSYPRSYYESAIRAGRILVSGKKVQPSYKIKGNDELTHTVHRHEPAVAISDITTYNICNTTTIPNLDQSVQPQHLIDIVHEDEHIIVVDKPSTLPVHPCGGYNLNSLFHVLVEQDPNLAGKLFTVHRLDRLTSGLTVVAKSAVVAKELSACVRGREEWQKIYLARVKGSFPMCARPEERTDKVDDSGDTTFWRALENAAKESPADTISKGFWITDEEGVIREDASLCDVFQSRIDITTLPGDSSASTSTPTVKKKKETLWLHLSCPCEILCHKNGVCQTGFGGKPAKTAFTVVGYDQATDSTVVMCKPFTGRTHQIRLHLQYLQHPIANDPNYGGELFFGDPPGLRACQVAQKKIDEADLTTSETTNDGGKTKSDRHPENALSTDVPASEEEIYRAGMYDEKGPSETLQSFIKRSCVWCARSRGENRSMLEFLVRSRGIWLHAFRYSMVVRTQSEGDSERMVTYETKPPAWSVLEVENK